jgi:aspartyl-tRNA(Asn)/glutamyl-tRNA(Gln) amidotransferase subunit C
MKLTREEVARVAVLARLRLTAAEESEFTAQLEQILGYMDKLNEIDTNTVLPFSHRNWLGDLVENLREDKVANKPSTDALLANAPDRDGTFFKVPKILE